MPGFKGDLELDPGEKRRVGMEHELVSATGELRGEVRDAAVLARLACRHKASVPEDLDAHTRRRTTSAGVEHVSGE